MGLRSGDEDGHVINFSLLNPTFARYSTVERAACDGALSCMKIIFFLNAGRLLRYQGIKLSWRKFRYVSAFIFTPSGTLKEGQQAHCQLSQLKTWHHHLVVVALLIVCSSPLQVNLCTSHLVKSRIVLHSSMERTVWKSVLTSISPISVPGG